ncbi:hypothetical protein DRJ24_03965 [Candidatus Acetothermia bacterium]|nr:MAG: hypothetical protein DRJ24_03965 [Candidatus Acetothermia bacterium]
MKMRRIMTGLLLFVLLGFALSAVADECEYCAPAIIEEWESHPPFERAHTDFCPYTLGLPIGAEAPAIPGVELIGRHTLIVFFNEFVCPEVGLLRPVSQIEGLQLVVVLSRLPKSTVTAITDQIGEKATVVADPTAGILCSSYYVGDHPGVAQMTFFVDEDGAIIHRRISPDLGWLAYDDFLVLLHFAETGTVPEGTILQHVLWYGDTAPWPEFPFETIEGGEAFLTPGRPRLFYWGFAPSSEMGGLIFRDLDTLRSEYPDVEFVWLIHYTSDDALTEIWTYYHLIGLDALHPEWFDIPFDEYMSKAREERDADLDALVTDVSAHAEGWTVLLDVDSRLSGLWSVAVWPSIMILDSDGTVLLPFTNYPRNYIGGEWHVHPGAIEELREILSAATEDE